MHALDLPRGIDDPPSLLLWRLDDLIPLILMIGILADRLLLFCCSAWGYPGSMAASATAARTASRRRCTPTTPFYAVVLG